jgi:ligand-binding SRPBCC domain-containing protein
VSWFLAHAERTLGEEVPAPADVVRDFYTDLNNLKTLHPLIVAVEATSRSQTAEGYTQAYRVKDRISLGPLVFPVSYTARLSVPTAGDVITEARQFPRVRLHGVVTFTPVGGATRVTEHIRFEVPRPLAAFTVRQAVAAHTEMLAGIRRHFD